MKVFLLFVLYKTDYDQTWGDVCFKALELNIQQRENKFITPLCMIDSLKERKIGKEHDIINSISCITNLVTHLFFMQM